MDGNQTTPRAGINYVNTLTMRSIASAAVACIPAAVDASAGYPESKP